MPEFTPPDPSATSSSLVDDALAWLVKLHSGQASDEDRQACEAWRTSSPAHNHAYVEAEALWRDIGQMRSENSAFVSASPPVIRSFKKVSARKTGWAIAASLFLMACLFSSDHLVEWFTAATADYHTAVGQQRVVRLADGSRMHLNTDTAVNVSFTDQGRDIRLLKGEAAFTVEPDVNRPFTVQSGEVQTRAIGTSFVVHFHHKIVTVTVTEHAVQVSTIAGDASTTRVVREGEQVFYTVEKGISSARSIDRLHETAWQRGKLIFEAKPLAEVVTELNRYRPGRIMIMNPALRPLKVTGLFDVADTDAALRMIQHTIPIHETTLTSYVVLLH
jgi:transmembrane sensor